MTPNETTQLRTMAEMNRRLRRENDRLRESLLLESKESKAFDDENVELFDVVHKNHKVRGGGYGKQKQTHGCPVGAGAGEPEAVQH